VFVVREEVIKYQGQDDIWNAILRRNVVNVQILFI